MPRPRRKTEPKRAPSPSNLHRFESPGCADPLELSIAVSVARLLLALGRLPAHSDFLERGLVACGSLLVWPADVLAALGFEPESDDECRSQLGASTFGDVEDESSWRCLASPALGDEIPPAVFRQMNNSPALRRRVARATLDWAEQSAAPRSPVLKNAAYMSEALRLGEPARRLIELVILLEMSSAFEDALTQMDLVKRHQLEHLLARFLDCDQRSVAELIGVDGVLTRIGLLSEDDGANNLGGLLMSGSRLFAQALTTEHASREAFLQSFLLRSAPGKLDGADTEHLGAARDMATRVLRSAADERARGINVLLHGAPGTGKTEFARQLAERAELSLYEVRYEGSNGQSLSPAQRLGSLLLSLQALRGQPKVAILLDEAEDIFTRCSRSDRPGRDDDVSKAWMTRLLEDNEVPTLWTSNRVHSMDAAIIRRFTLVHELGELPKSVKARIAARYLAPLELGPERIPCLASLPGLAPAQLESGAIATTLARPGDANEAWHFLRLQLDESRRAMGLSPVLESVPAAVPYDPAFLRIRGMVQPDRIVAGLARGGASALCFHGAPGTGKTAFARHIAEALDRELISTTASDLLSMWVGDTEHRIADLFSRAAQRADKVVLLLDEADTFLRDRSQAGARWEISHTNEFLARMEAYPGIFICTTNLMDRLDTAVLRRFQFRLEFLGLGREQSLAMFELSFGRPALQAEAEALSRLAGRLAPSDFVNVARRLRFLDREASAADLAAQLSEECMARGEGGGLSRAIGFIH